MVSVLYFVLLLPVKWQRIMSSSAITSPGVGWMDYILLISTGLHLIVCACLDVMYPPIIVNIVNNIIHVLIFCLAVYYSYKLLVAIWRAIESEVKLVHHGNNDTTPEDDTLLLSFYKVRRDSIVLGTISFIVFTTPVITQHLLYTTAVSSLPDILLYWIFSLDLIC